MSFERIAEDLMDSIRVRSELDAFAAVWRKKGTTDAERAVRLAALLKVLPTTANTGAQTAKALPPKAAVGLESEAPLTPEEVAAIRREDASNKPEYTEDQIRELVLKTYGPKLRIMLNGVEQAFRIPVSVNGHSVPMQGWESALRQRGVAFNELEVRVTPNAKYFDLVPM